MSWFNHAFAKPLRKGYEEEADYLSSLSIILEAVSTMSDEDIIRVITYLREYLEKGRKSGTE